MSNPLTHITSPEDSGLDRLCEQLDELSSRWKTPADWPARSLELCREYGVFRWFVATRWGGLGWSEQDIVRGYLRLSSACLTTTFVITQFVAACRRIASAEDDSLKTRLLPELAAGRTFATVGISHLTTSRRHLNAPVLKAESVAGGWVLSGYSPWVTGGPSADNLVVGATLSDGSQVLLVTSMQSPGIRTENGFDLVGLSASQTGKVVFDDVFVSESEKISGPADNIMSTGGGSTGGLQTSTLAIGLSWAAIDYLHKQSALRPELAENIVALEKQFEDLRIHLLNAAEGNPSCTTEDLRIESNSLVLRSTQSALVAAKGAGYVEGHPVGRWCREALFFLVWSCPQPVAHANLCELAGLEI